MAIKLLIDCTRLTFSGGQLLARLEIQHETGPTLGTSLLVDPAPLTPTNVITGLKNQAISYVQATYGITLTAAEILVLGGLQ